MCADLLLELGHSRIKWARAESGAIDEASAGASAPEALDELAAILRGNPCKRAWLAATPGGAVLERVRSALTSAGVEVREIATGNPDLPVKPAYEGLGVDRWLSLQWPWIEHRRPFCIADCGTALTVDVVDARGLHRGGWIMPGHNAARVGLVSAVPALERPPSAPAPAELPATDTAAAIVSGLIMQQAGAVGLCRRAAARALGEEPTCFLTGGDAGRVLSQLRQDQCEDQSMYRADPFLVLRGMAIATTLGR